MVRTGANSFLQWDFDNPASAFGTPYSSPSYKKFGLQQKITSFTVNNTKKTLSELASVKPTDYAYGKQNGSISVDFVLSSPWILGLLFGAPAKTNSTGSAAATQTYTTTANDSTVRTSTLQMGFQGQTANLTRTLSGCTLNSLAITAAVDDMVNASADFAYAKEQQPTTSFSASSATDLMNFPYTFAHGLFKWKGNTGDSLTTQTEIQNMDITFAQNSELLFGMNSHFAVDAYRQLFDITGKFQVSLKDRSFITNIMEQIKADSGTTNDTRSHAQLELFFTNKGTGNGLKTIKITCDGIGIDSHSITGLEPNEPVFEDISWQIKNAVIVAQTATTNDEPIGS
tara:strand:- start:51 stop:1076 length:1026 start_codon:yes stop_codon:yes gene_type:complete